MKKSGIILIALFVVSVVFAAQIAAQDAAPSGVVRVGSWESGDALTPWNNAIAAFEAEHPDIDVQLEAVPQGYGDKLLAQFASGTAPDIFMSGDGDVSKWVALDAVENLDPYIDGPNGFDRSLLFPAVAAFGQVNGSTYYLTKDYSPLIVYYNSDLFESAGVDVPTASWTWADLVSAAQKLTLDASGNDATSPDFDANNVTQWGIQMPYTWSRAILPIIFADGGSVIAPDGSTYTGAMNSEATVAALQSYADLYNTHVAPSNADVQSYSGTDMFQSGLVAMSWTGVWPLNGYKAVPDFHFGTTSLPAGTDGNANVLCWSGFGMYSGSQNKDAAWEFLKYIGAGDGAAEFAQYAWTPVISVAEAQGLNTDPLTADIVADLDNLQPIPEQVTPYWGCGGPALEQQLATVLDSGVAVQDAMDTAAAQADTCLADQMSQQQ